jgi:S1-C subfamily serine protease
LPKPGPIEEVLTNSKEAIAQIFTDDGSGTGFCTAIDPEGRGIVVTNKHVVWDEQRNAAVPEAVVAFGDRGEPHPAKLVGSHPWADIAVLVSDGKPTSTLEYREEAARLGESCLVIGFPHSVGLSLSHGIISGLDRESVSPNGFPVTMIQTDASINSGNSGGPMLDMDGKVLGVACHTPRTSKKEKMEIEGLGAVTTIQLEEPEGLSFLVPADLASAAQRAILEGNGEELAVGDEGIEWSVAKHKSRLHKLGFIQTNRFMDGALGVLVLEVAPESPAERAGILKGDLLVRIGGKPVDHPADLYAWRIASTSWEEDSEFELDREGKSISISIRAEKTSIGADDLTSVWRIK